MKNIFKHYLSVTLICTLLIFSCSSDDDKTTPVIDKIAENLTTSLTAYQNANDGDWVEIIEAEYFALQVNITGAFVCGTSNDQFDNGTVATSYTDLTVANVNVGTIEPNNYLFAFKYRFESSVPTVIQDVEVIISEDPNENFTRLGNALPSHTGIFKTVYFVLKGSDQKVNNDQYLGMYTPKSLTMIDVETCHIAMGKSLNNLGTIDGRSGKYQGLQTATKQW